MSGRNRASRPACFGELLRLDGMAAFDPRAAGAAVERVLRCGKRYCCGERLACSWMASDLAQRALRGIR